VQLVSKISNICDHNPPTSRTDVQTDGRTNDMRSQDRALHCSASRGKKCKLDSKTPERNTDNCT